MPGVDVAVKLNNKVIAPISKTTETETSVSEFELPTQVVIKEPKISETTEVFDLKLEFDKPVAVIKKAYDMVFSKSSNFKPEFGETVGDMILYLSAKLRAINASKAFDKALKISDYKIPEKYLSGYIPLAIKLSLWCKDKGVLDICDELLFEISSVYIKSAKSANVIVTEEDIETAFSLEINAVFNK